MKLVFISGPYTVGDPVANTHNAIRAGESIERLGCAVFIPHLSLLWHLVSPAPIEAWYERDLAILERCDALVRLPGESRGADAEVARATELGIPTFDVALGYGRFLCWLRHGELFPEPAGARP